ncbi:hypothetical protein ACH5RR_007550 [Cinchona calisaya]|uniref:Uncharacterized protein n=1 Tax=Cinchona calisaya TaxID=153742 RepID=A0ABD3AS39_9GENT
MKFLEVVEMEYGSQEKYKKIKFAIKNIREEFLIMSDSSENLMGCDLANAVAQDIDDQLMSNVDLKLQNPTYVIPRGEQAFLNQSLLAEEPIATYGNGNA